MNSCRIRGKTLFCTGVAAGTFSIAAYYTSQGCEIAKEAFAARVQFEKFKQGCYQFLNIKSDGLNFEPRFLWKTDKLDHAKLCKHFQPLGLSKRFEEARPALPEQETEQGLIGLPGSDPISINIGQSLIYSTKNQVIDKAQKISTACDTSSAFQYLAIAFAGVFVLSLGYYCWTVYQDHIKRD